MSNDKGRHAGPEEAEQNRPSELLSPDLSQSLRRLFLYTYDPVQAHLFFRVRQNGFPRQTFLFFPCAFAVSA